MEIKLAIDQHKFQCTKNDLINQLKNDSNVKEETIKKIVDQYFEEILKKICLSKFKEEKEKNKSKKRKRRQH